MSVKKSDQPTSIISTTIISPDGPSCAFHRINIEYFYLYHDIDKANLGKAVTQGLKLGFLATTQQRESAAQWKNSYHNSFNLLCNKAVENISQLTNKLPQNKLRTLSTSTKILKKQLIAAPNNYLQHFHIAWLYLLVSDLRQAEVHFNISALQSQEDNPELACFALRHLAEVRYRANRYPQALLAIKKAMALSTEYNAELHFEYVRLLSLATLTSESLKQLTQLIHKAPEYECIASVDSDLRKNPTVKRFLVKLSQTHMQNILSELNKRWENDPLRLLDLDKELGIPNSIESIKKKKINTIKNLPELLLSDEKLSSMLIHQQSRQFILKALNARKQYYVQNIEQHQYHASRIHKVGQWLIYSSVVSVMALALSHAISFISKTLGYDLLVNQSVQGVVLALIVALIVVGMILLHFTPTKLKALIKKKQQLEQLSAKFGLST